MNFTNMSARQSDSDSRQVGIMSFFGLVFLYQFFTTNNPYNKQEHQIQHSKQ